MIARVTLAFVFVLGSPVAVPAVAVEEFQRHVVVAQEFRAADVGRETLRSGGNAIDAAVATAFALAVTHPAAGNLGGGGFIVAYLADRDEVVTIDFRERAPRAASARLYLDGDGRLIEGHRAGVRAAGVPGTVRGLGLAHERFGSKPWTALVEPAIRLAEEGFPVSEPLARSLNEQLRLGQDGEVDLYGAGGGARLGDFPASVEAFSPVEDSIWKAGATLRQPDLAKTLQRIAERGPDEFYEGGTAALIVQSMRDGNGLITAEDLQRYRAVERPPVRTTYRGSDVYGVGPPSSGGVVLAIMLNMLERFDLKALGPEDPETLHLVAEAMKRAFAVRAVELADPDYVEVPTARLVSKPFAEKLAGSIGETATPSEELVEVPIADLQEGAETTHLSVIDAQGNAVALTYTLEQGYGSKAVVPGAGFLLNNEMGDFNLIPGRTDRRGRIGTMPNRIEPGKRMLSSQCPTLVLRDGRVQVITGSPGGRTIPNTVLWVLLRVLEFENTPEAAVQAPRAHHGWFPDRLVLEGDTWPEPTLEELRRRGHRLGSRRLQGDAHTIVVDPETGAIHGVADPRRGTSKASGD